MIKLEINESDKDEGVGINIWWVDAPKCGTLSDADWLKFDTAWKSLTNRIHAFLACLGPIPKNGWEVKLYCDDYSKIK